MRSIFTGAKKCGGEKPHKGRKPDCGFLWPEPPKGGEAYTDLLCVVWAAYNNLYKIITPCFYSLQFFSTNFIIPSETSCPIIR